MQIYINFMKQKCSYSLYFSKQSSKFVWMRRLSECDSHSCDGRPFVLTQRGQQEINNTVQYRPIIAKFLSVPELGQSNNTHRTAYHSCHYFLSLYTVLYPRNSLIHTHTDTHTNTHEKGKTKWNIEQDYPQDIYSSRKWSKSWVMATKICVMYMLTGCTELHHNIYGHMRVICH